MFLGLLCELGRIRTYNVEILRHTFIHTSYLLRLPFRHITNKYIRQKIKIVTIVLLLLKRSKGFVIGGRIELIYYCFHLLHNKY